jgi:hypothetical protein
LKNEDINSNIKANEYYGILFRDQNGDPTFYVNEEGHVEMTGATVDGNINARGGHIEGILTIGQDNTKLSAQIGGSYALQAGINNGDALFSVDLNGNTIAKSITLENMSAISGTIQDATITNATIQAGTITDANVVNATIENGTIKEAVIESIRFSKNDTQSYIGLPKQGGNYIQVSDVFSVGYDGHVRANKLTLADEIVTIDSKPGPDKPYFEIVVNNDSLLTVTDSGLNLMGSMKSTDFFSGQKGWGINSDGTAEFNDVTIRGTLSTVVFEHQ